MYNKLSPTIYTTFIWYAILLVVFHQVQDSEAQQSYVDNMQLDCQLNDSRTLGYDCNGEAKSCKTFLTFRSTPVYNSPVTIAYLLGAEASEIAQINKISDVDKIPPDTLVIVPTSCSCSGKYYQHNSSYVLKDELENYYTVANLTYQGLTTCQAMIAQNPYNYLKLEMNMKLNVPLRCACPTKNQTALEYKYLAVYLVDWGDSYEAIASMFNADLQSIYVANRLSPEHLIYPFTPLLIPLKSEPTNVNTSMLSLPPLSPPQLQLSSPPSDGNGSSSRKWVFAGVGIGIGLLLLCAVVGVLLWFFRYRQGGTVFSGSKDESGKKIDPESFDVYKALEESESKSWSEGIKSAIGTLTLYKYEELQKATGCFAEGSRIKGSIFRGNFKGDYAAVKMIKGNVLGEINLLKQINHSNIIRLSGFCLHEGNTYLVYEYAESGSLSDLLHDQNKGMKSYDQLQQESYSSSVLLNWKQRVQITYDVADALNYLHNYANPPYIHKNLKSSNILLDGNMRAKLTNFGLAKALGSVNQSEDEDSVQLQMTRHVIGTQGYMAPEYIENGLVTPKLDVFAFGVVILELLSGREATHNREGEAKAGGEELLSVTITQVIDGENVRQKLRDFIDPCLKQEYPQDLAYSMAQLAKKCVAHDLNSRPTIAEVFVTVSKILSTSLDWDPSDELEHSRSVTQGS